jgi:hypothetical protein
MVLHIVKLAVGADSVADIAEWQKHQMREARRLKRRVEPVCGTRMWPKRAEEVLHGGSLYWVVKGLILVRQRILAIEEVVDEHGARCGLYLDPGLTLTAPQPRRAFQGWRYLDPKDAPADAGNGAAIGSELPDDLKRRLVTLGAW